jgi:predicted PurR-regulated permease PerM
MDRETGPALFLTLLVCSLVLVIFVFFTYISALVLAMLLASVCQPVQRGLRKLLGKKGALAPSITTFLLLLVLIVPVGWFVETLSKEAFDFYDRTRDSVSQAEIQKFIESDNIWAVRIRRSAKAFGLSLDHEVLNQLATFLGKDVGLFVYKQLSSVASNLLSFLIHFFLMIATIYFLFKDGERLKEYILQLLPVPARQVEKVAGKFHEMARALIVGNGLSGLIQGVFGGLGFFFFDLPSPFLWGTIIAVTAFLPIIGAAAVFVPAALIILIQGSPGTALFYLLYNLAYSATIEYGLKPRFISKGMSMNPLLVFLGILGGMKLFGIMGIVYGPLIITVFLTMAEIYRLEYRSQRGSEGMSKPI